MSLTETSARRVVLAQAIETADSQGKLVSEVERELIDQQAREAARSAARAAEVPADDFLDLRAQRVLSIVGGRHQAVASLQAASPWRSGLMVAVPVGTMLLGALTERIADPHRVDLLSLPLLAIILWNVAVYLFMVAGGLLPRRGRVNPVLSGLRRWSAAGWRSRSGRLRADVTAQFHLLWNAATASLQVQRWKALLHLAALGWAAGVAASLLVQGLVVEYRVGWESTFLDARQVHAILSVLLWPVVWLLPFDGFSVQEIARLQLGPSSAGQVEPRWVWMYVALLSLVVMVPRAVLAGVALARAKLLARNVRLDLRAPYFQRIVSLLHPAQVKLGIVTHRPEDRAALMHVLVQEQEVAGQLISSPAGDRLSFVELPADIAPPAAGPAQAEPGWLQRLMNFARGEAGGRAPRSGDGRLDAAREECHVVLHVAGAAADLEEARATLEWLGKPVLLLVHRAAGPEADPPGLVARGERHARSFPLVARVLSFDSFARCWVQEGVLLDAIRRTLPEALGPGFERIAAAWHARNGARFGRSMQAVAEHLIFAARQVEELPGGTLSMRSLVVSGERQAQALARQGAVQHVVERLGRSAADMFATLRDLHGIDDSMADELEEGLEQKFVVHQPIDAPQAAMAGAAGGAATGASVDLLAGGLTLGAATALGALVGASAAFIGAALKNRSTPGGATLVQLSDEMMQALVEAGLLRYLAAAHHGRSALEAGSEIRPFWKAEVVAAVQAHNTSLAPFWTAARAQPEPEQVAALARELETIAMRLLNTLYPKPLPTL
ncbi:MAG: hypothetical protein K0R03_2638 [Moraxellaceae bacterium]|jgi:hypothetical protein|nr:hypothetical protein [Moraxellaceae bacterium]